ncbi:MAG: hypothetical protein ACLP50_11880 [Solirubrobacteraceae bacterium]
MSWAHYSEMDACIEIKTKTDRTGEHVIDRFVVVSMTDDRERHDPAVCPLTLLGARRIALELLEIVSAAETANQQRGDQR